MATSSLRAVQPVARVTEAGDDVPRSFRPRSTAAETMRTSGMLACMWSIPSGAATRQTSRSDLAPASFTAATAATVERPVASIGSSTIASRSASRRAA